jgi:hypothetical protein
MAIEGLILQRCAAADPDKPRRKALAVCGRPSSRDNLEKRRSRTKSNVYEESGLSF